jgi:hypothetical protein
MQQHHQRYSDAPTHGQRDASRSQREIGSSQEDLDPGGTGSGRGVCLEAESLKRHTNFYRPCAAKSS